MDKKTPVYPYLPKGKEFRYATLDNPYMQAAKKFCENNSLDKAVPTGSAVVKDNQIIGLGANGSTYHQTHICERVRQNIPTGQGYELCEGCHPKNHSEPRAIQQAIHNGYDPSGADLYLWGHWWCCQPCWTSMLDAGINNVYVLENSHTMFRQPAKPTPAQA